MVTGGSGFVGGHLARALCERGDVVTVLDLRPPAVGDVAFVRGDAGDPSVVADVLEGSRIEAVVHAAGVLGEGPSLAEPRRFLAVDAEAVWDLCEVVRARPWVGRLLTLSSRSVYGAYRAEEGPVGEEVAPRPVGFYGAAKAAADLGVSRYKHALGLDVVAARITGPYGPGQRYPTAAGELLDAVAAGRPVRRSTGADDRYEAVYVKDTVAGVLSLLDAPTLAHAVYNVGSGRLVALGAVAGALRRLVPDAVVELGPGCGDPVPRAAMSVDRIRAETGFVASWSLEAGLADALGAMGRPPTGL